MTQKIARALPGRLIGKKAKPGAETFRLCGPDDKPLMTRDHKPVDGGGYVGKNLAVMRADEINDYYDKLRAQEAGS